MKVAADEIEFFAADYDGRGAGICPHCDASLIDFADDVSDADYQKDYKDVAAVDCPKCGKRIALVRTSSYRLGKFKEPDEKVERPEKE